MSDSVGKISLDLELQSDLSKQISESAGKIGEELKASLQNIGKLDFSKITSNISNTLKATMDKALGDINTRIESVFNTAGDTVSETINITKENALSAIAEIKKAAEEMTQSLATMTKKIKFPRIFPNPKDIPAPNAIPPGAPMMPRGPPIGVKIPKIDLSSNTEYIKSQIDNLSNSLDITNAKIEAQQAKLTGLRESYTLAFNQDRKNKIEEQILKTETAINKLIGQSDKAGFELADLDKRFEELSNSTKNATSGIKAFFSGIKKAAGSVAIFKSKLKGTSSASKNISKETGLLGRAAVGTGNNFNHMGNMISRSFSRVLKQVFVVGVIYKALRGLISYTGSALMTNAQFVHSLNQIRTNLQVAFMPIYQAVLPALNALMSALSTVTAYIATFINAIFGKTYKQSFNAAKGLNKARAAMGAYGKSAKNAGADTKKMAKDAKDAQKVLAGFDEINTLSFDKNKAPKADSGGADIPPMVMPDVDVSPASAAGKAIEGIAKKVKAVLASIFQPFQNAWAKDGAGVTAEFKKAIEGTKTTLKNFFVMLGDPAVQKFIESIARLGLEIGKLFLFIYNNYFLPLLNWLIEKTPFVTELLTPLFNGISDFIEWLMGDGKPVLDIIVIVLGSMFLAFKLVTGVVGIATKVMNGFGAVMVFIKSPIGIAILAIGAIIAIGILLYKHWDFLKAKAGEVWEGIKVKFSEFKNWLGNVFATDWSRRFGFLGDILNGFHANVRSIWDSIKRMFNGIIDFIAGVFTGNWSRAWRGVVNIFGSIFDGIKALAKAPLNGVISLVNGAIGGLNKIKLPDWVPGIGGKGISIPKIPYLAKGGIVDSPTLSMVGEAGKEAVVPLENNTGWIDNLAGQIAGKIGGVGNNEILEILKQILKALTDRDGDIIIKIGESEFARIAIAAINKAQRQAGKTLLEV